MRDMQAVILAGGLGTRLSEETREMPKPMVKIGDKPILWHIMKIYSHYNINRFIICCGYKGYQIKEYFLNYAVHNSDLTIDMNNGSHTIHRKCSEPWTVTLVDTGAYTATGGRLSRVREYLHENQPFHFTYGDGVADVDLDSLLGEHKASGKLATITAAHPSGRFGTLNINSSGEVIRFSEKTDGKNSWVNAGFSVLEKSAIDLVNDDTVSWEEGPLPQLAQAGQLGSHRHNGFWHPMDTVRDKNFLNSLWLEGRAPWKKW